MNRFNYALAAAVAVIGFTATTPKAEAQVNIDIGAGPWFHGPDHFRGHVDNRFDVHRGYRGPVPNRGDSPEPSKHLDQIEHFRGNEMRDGRGHAGGGRR